MAPGSVLKYPILRLISVAGTEGLGLVVIVTMVCDEGGGAPE